MDQPGTYRFVMDSPLGWLRIVTAPGGLRAIHFEDHPAEETTSPDTLGCEVQKQLQAYFAGALQVFTLPLDPRGTPFQLRIWKALAEIPFGRTLSYRELSLRTGDEKAIRAVGQANGRNPLPILLPCHRVIGSDGSLTGYGGGLWRKKWLLRHEHALPAELPF